MDARLQKLDMSKSKDYDRWCYGEPLADFTSLTVLHDWIAANIPSADKDELGLVVYAELTVTDLAKAYLNLSTCEHTEELSTLKIVCDQLLNESPDTVIAYNGIR